MSSKLDFIPVSFNTYEDVKKEMYNDFQWRVENRTDKTLFGTPLYYRINVQMVITNACPYNCSFCLERQNPQGAVQNFARQLSSLKTVLKYHPNARISITGGEPALYPEHVKQILEIAKPTASFIAVNTTDYKTFAGLDLHINISDNSEVHTDLSECEFKNNVTVQTILADKDMNVNNIKSYIYAHSKHKSFSFRYLTDIKNSDYDVSILRELRTDTEIKIHTFRIGDFFMYITGEYKERHFRITLGDMKLQQERCYNGTYSNVIINPDGDILLNWNNKN